MVSGLRWDAASCTGASAEQRCHAAAVRLEPSVVVGRIQKGIVSASDRLSSFPHRSEVTGAQCRPSGSQTAARAGEHRWAERLSGAMHVYIAHLGRPPSLLYRPVVQVVST